MNDFDPQAPFVGSDGLEYENCAAYFCDQPIKNIRNGNVCSYRHARYGEEAVFAYARAFDSCKIVDQCPGNNAFAQRHAAGLVAAKQTGKFHPPNAGYVDGRHYYELE